MKRHVERIVIDQVVFEGVPTELQGRVLVAMQAELVRLAETGPPVPGALPVALPSHPDADAIGVAAARSIWSGHHE
ncbi:MAG: hypothetical protein AAGA48_20690 [Myxococcota bacterium]